MPKTVYYWASISDKTLLLMMGLAPLILVFSHKAAVPLLALTTLLMVWHRQPLVRLRQLILAPKYWSLLGWAFATFIFCLLLLSMLNLARASGLAEEGFRFLLIIALGGLWPLFRPRFGADLLLVKFVFSFSLILATLLLASGVILQLNVLLLAKASWAFHDFNVPLAILAALSFVLMAYSKRSIVYFTAALAPFAIWLVSLSSISEAVQYGLALILPLYIAAFLLLLFFQRPFYLLGFGFLVLMLLIAPVFFGWISDFVLVKTTPNSAFKVRASLWVELSQYISSPGSFSGLLVGNGLDVMSIYQNLPVAKFPPPFTPESNPHKIIHPHNIFLQAWLDGGFALVIALMSLIAITFLLIQRLNLFAGLAATAMVSLMVFIALVSHSLFADWVWASYILTGLLFWLVLPKTAEDEI